MVRRRRVVRTSRNIHRFKRIATLGTVGCNAVGFLSYATAFRINQIPGISEFTALYDQYRIDKVVFRAIPYTTENATTGTTPPWGLAPVYTVIDLDSAATPPDTATLREYTSVRTHQALKPVVRVLRPRALTQIYRSTTSTAYALANPRQWLDLGETDVPHYGIKMAAQLPNVSASNWLAYNLEAIFYFSMRAPK